MNFRKLNCEDIDFESWVCNNNNNKILKVWINDNNNNNNNNKISKVWINNNNNNNNNNNKILRVWINNNNGNNKINFERYQNRKLFEKYELWKLICEKWKSRKSFEGRLFRNWTART